jgi:hypothetical protein
MMRSTRDSKLTMKAMGHVDVRTAARYQHPDTSEIAGVMNQRNAKNKSATTEDGHTFGHSFGHREVPIQ